MGTKTVIKHWFCEGWEATVSRKYVSAHKSEDLPVMVTLPSLRGVEDGEIDDIKIHSSYNFH